MTKEEIELKRQERKASKAKEREAQYVKDLEALDALEQEHGDGCVTFLTIERDGLPTMAIARCPHEVELKRFRARVTRKKDGDPIPDPVPATEEVANACLLYPERDVFNEMCKTAPNLRSQLGTEALKLSAGKTEAEGKG